MIAARVLLYCAIVVGILGGLTWLSPTALTLATHLVVICTVAGLIWTARRSGGLDLASPMVIFSALFLLFIGFRGYTISLTGQWGSASHLRTPVNPDDEAALIGAMLIAVVAYGLFVGGFVSTARLPRQHEALKSKPMPRWMEAAATPALLVGLAVSASVLFYFVQRSGGLVQFAALLSIRNVAFRGEGWRLAFIHTYKLAVLLYFIVNFVRITSSPAGRVRFGLLLIPALVFDISTGGRASAVQTVFILAILYVLLRRRVLRMRTAMILIAVGIVFMTVYQGALREQGWRQGRVAQGSLMETVSNNLVRRGELASLDGFALIVRDVPERMEWQYGRTLVASVFTLVPRRLFPNEEKPVGAMTVFTSRMFPEHWSRTGSQLSTGMLGDFYMNFGVFGVILFLPLGALWGLVSTHVRRGRLGGLGILLYASVLAVQLNWFRGDTWNAVGVIVSQLVALLPVLVVLAFFAALRTVSAPARRVRV